MSRCVFIYLSDPTHRHHGGTIRVRNFAAAMEKAGIDVTLAFPSSPATATEAGSNSRLRRLKRDLLPMPTMLGATDPALSRRIRETKADFAVVSVTSQWPLAFSLGIPVWVDFMDVWSTFATREGEARKGLFALTARMQGKLLADAENRYGCRAALVTTAGWKDHEELLSRQIPSNWIPTSLPGDPLRGQHVNPPNHPTIGFIGNFDYWPNVEAYRSFVDEWVEPLTRLGWRCLVAGLKSEALPPDPRVENIGSLDDVGRFYARVTATAAPIKLGGGMKVKVVESLLRGKPVVATIEATEGLPPSVRALVTEVTSPAELPPPAQLPEIQPDHPALQPFGLQDTENRVADLLNRKGLL